MILVMSIFTSAAGHAEDVLQWSSQGDAITLDPHAENEGLTLATQGQIYEPLIELSPDLELIPTLATSWSFIDDDTWSFDIRPDVRFHQGQSLTVDDVVFSFERALHEKSAMKTIIESIDRVEAVGESQIHIHTKGPNPILPNQITNIYIMSRDWAEANDVVTPQDRAAQEENYAVRNANGTGAFMLELREPDVRTVMIKNPDWWGLTAPDLGLQPHNIDRLVLRPVSSNATRVAALLSGEIDFVLDTPLQDVPRIQRTPGLKIETVPEIRTIFLGLNMGVAELSSSDIKGRNPFAEPLVREAVNVAIDATAIQKKVMRGQSEPAGFISSPGVHGYTEELDTRLAYNLARAKDLMAEAGYADGFGVQLDCPNNRYVNDEAICQAVVSMLAKIGIRVSLNAQPKSLHFPLIQNSQTDFYMLGWSSATLDSHYSLTFLADPDNPWGATGFRDARLLELIAQIGVETDPAKRDQEIDEAWSILKASNAYVPLHHQVLVWSMSDKIDIPIQADNVPQFRFAQMK